MNERVLCQLCSSETDDKAHYVTHGRLFKGPICGRCRDDPVEEVNQRLLMNGVIDRVRRTIVRDLISHRHRGHQDDPIPDKVITDVITSADVDASVIEDITNEFTDINIAQL